MNLDKLIIELQQLQSQGHGNKEVYVIDEERNVYSFEGICDLDYMLDEFGVCLKYE